MPPTAGHNKFKKAWIISQCYTWDWAASVESCSQCFSWSRHRSILSRLSLSTTTLRACNCVFAHCYDFINYNAFILHGVTRCIFTNLFDLLDNNLPRINRSPVNMFIDNSLVFFIFYQLFIWSFYFPSTKRSTITQEQGCKVQRSSTSFLK